MHGCWETQASLTGKTTWGGRGKTHSHHKLKTLNKPQGRRETDRFTKGKVLLKQGGEKKNLPS